MPERDSSPLWVFLAGAGTLVVGLIAGFRLFRPEQLPMPPMPLRQSEFRESMYHYINPLLGLNIPETRGFPILRRSLDDLIDNAVADNRAQAVSFYFKELDTSEWFGRNYFEVYNPASMMKVATMMAYLRAAESDPSILSAKLHYDARTDRNVSERLRSPRTMDAGNYTIEALIEQMIRHSDNNAAVMLTDYATAKDLEILNQPYLDLGVEPPEVAEDYLTVVHYSLLLRVLYNATYLSRPMSEKALELLTQTDFHDGLVKGIPAGVVVAHKFGEFGLSDLTGRTIRNELHDCGIVYDPRSPYLLCVMTKGDDLGILANLIARISSTVYESQERRSRD